MHSISSRRLVGILLGCALTSLVAVTWLALQEQRRADERSSQITQARELQISLLTMQASFLEVESSASKYILTGDPFSLVRFSSARDRVHSRLDAVCTQSRTQHTSVDGCSELKQMVDDELRSVEYEVSLREASGTDSVVVPLRQANATDPMLRLTDQLSYVREAEQRLLDSRRAANQRDSSTVREAIVGGVGLGFFLVALSFVLLIRDTRSRLRAEVSMRKAMESTRSENERYRVLIEGITDYAIFMLDSQGFITSWNRGAQHLKGYREEEIVGKHFSLFYTTPDLASQKPERELEIAAATGRYEEEGWRLRKDQSRFWANVLITKLCDESGDVLGFAKVTRDISPRKVAEEALALERRKLRAAFEHADMGLILSDAQGQTLSLNATAMLFPAMAVMSESSAPVGQLESEWEVHGPEGKYLPPNDWPLQKAIRGEYSRETRLDVSNRATRRSWVLSFTSVAARTEAGDVDMIVISLLDITQRVAAERAVLELTSSLERRVSERTEQLENANRELESFSYSVSHDLRAPLRHVQGYIRMLLRECSDGQLSEKAQHYLETIRAATAEMGQLIDGLLAFARTNYLEISESAIDLDRLVHDTILATEGSTQGREIAWEVGDLPTVYGDPIAVRQVYANLLENAVKYTIPRSGARIEVGSAGHEGGRVILFVRDNGVGFDMQFAGKLFGLFERLHRDARFEGTGTGLAIVHRLVTRHGGRVWAEAAPNRGAAFFFTMAISPSSEVEQERMNEISTTNIARGRQ